MHVCKRCHGYISTTYRDFSDSDPCCLNCGCSYPELNTSIENAKKRERKGLREAISYTGKSSYRKKQIGYITYAEHPNIGSLYPMLIVECPICTKKSKILTAASNPFTETVKLTNGYQIAKETVKCPTGHFFRLKVNNKGMYSWE